MIKKKNVECSECRHSLADGSRSEFVCETNTCLVEADIISGVNSNAAAGWKAANYSELWGRTLEDGFLLRLGTLEPERFVIAPAISYLFILCQ